MVVDRVPIETIYDIMRAGGPGSIIGADMLDSSFHPSEVSKMKSN